LLLGKEPFILRLATTNLRLITRPFDY